MYKEKLRRLRNRVQAVGGHLALKFTEKNEKKHRVGFVVEKANWSIRWDGEHICDVVNRVVGKEMAVVEDAVHRVGGHKVVHFGSQYMWLDWGHLLPTTNKFVVSFFHGKPEDGPEVEQHIKRFVDSVPRLDTVVTAGSLIEQRLLDWGVPRDKLVRIPIGVDTRTFCPPTAEQRQQARQRFGFSDQQIVIGSFQKDGVGWGDGMEAKLIKGPDLFVEAVEKIARSFPVVVLLTGPARGYVKSELEKRRIQYVHTYQKNQEDLVHCYHALDMYLVTSREEGGPKGIMESMASGVQIVSTNVGMAADLVQDGLTGGLVRSFSSEDIANKAIQQLASETKEQELLAAREAVSVADWSVVGHEHWTRAYEPALRRMGHI